MSELKLFDSQVHFGTSLFGYELQQQALLSQMDRLEIGRAVLCPSRPHDYQLGPANDGVAAAVASTPARFVGFARVDPWQGALAVEELTRCRQSLGLRGLYLDPWEDHFVISDPLVRPVVERAADLALPVMIAGGYPNFSHPSQIAALAVRYPRMTFIVTHAGQLNISGLLLGEAAAMFRACPNVIAQTSGVYREDFIEDCIAEFGADRLVFGSGAPVFDQAFETLRVHKAHVSDEVKQQIGWANLARVLGESDVRG